MTNINKESEAAGLSPLDTFLEAAMKVGRGPMSAAEVALAMKTETQTKLAISRISDSLNRSVDDRIAAILKRRLAVDVIDWRGMKGRLGRVVTQGAGYETYLLDGRPFARVYAPALIEKPGFIAFDQAVEELAA